MKYFFILIAVILLASCSGTKKVLENQPEQTSDVVSKTDTPKQDEPDLTPTPSASPQINETVFSNTTGSEFVQIPQIPQNSPLRMINHHPTNKIACMRP